MAKAKSFIGLYIVIVLIWWCSAITRGLSFGGGKILDIIILPPFHFPLPYGRDSNLILHFNLAVITILIQLIFRFLKSYFSKNNRHL